MVRDVVIRRRPPEPGRAVAVLGAGVMGLTAATRLREAGYSVTIYAEALTGTTSDVAGGQWAPSSVQYETTPAGKAQFARILQQSYDAHRGTIGQGLGVVERINYCRQKSPGLERAVAAGVIASPQRVPRLPFARLTAPGWAYRTLLVETPIFLRRLRDDLRSHVPFRTRRFLSRTCVAGLAEPIVVNCTGMGARALFGDRALRPVKGQIVLLKAQPALEYLYSTGSTYVFPRSDCVVVGGSYEEGRSDTAVDRALLREILAKARGEFEGVVLRPSQKRGWMKVPA